MCFDGLIDTPWEVDPPDMSGVNAAAATNAQVAKDALDFYKQQYADQAPLRERAQANADAVSAAQLDMMKSNQALSEDYANYQKDTFRPIERGIVDAARNYDTEARRTQEADAAVADVNSQLAAQRGASARAAASMGVNPNSGRAAALDAQNSVAGAAAAAGAANKARKNVELQGYARTMDAANLGRGLASNQATSAGVALNAGNSSASNGTLGAQIQQQGTQLMGQGFNTAITGNNSAGSLFNTAAMNTYNANLASANAETQAFGQAAGAAAKYFSDVNLKSDIEPMQDESALQAIASTPVSKWKYDPAKGGPDDGGQQHIGPMAQDVQATMGDKVAPGGKKIDIISMNGVALAGIRALDKKVNALASLIQQSGIAGAAA